MRGTLILTGVALSAFAQNSKPSPIGRTRAESAAAASARAAERHAEPETASKPKQEPAGLIVRTADTGPACFYRVKALASTEQDSTETPLNATHPTLPLGTRVKVTNLDNKMAVVVTISEHSSGTDYIICVNYAAAEKLGLVRSGVAQVHLEKL